MSSRIFQYACVFSGFLSIIFAFVSLAVSGFLPPIPPWWDAERTVQHYRDHEKGVLAGAAIMMMAGLFFFPLAAVISAQMRRIPNLHYVVSALQLASGAASASLIIMIAVIMAVAVFRLDRPVEITQSLNDLFWILFAMTWPSFTVQTVSLAYAVIIDCRPKPLFPKLIAILSILLSFATIPATVAVHCFKAGSMAWNGAVAFWLPNVMAGVSVIVECVCLARAVSTE